MGRDEIVSMYVIYFSVIVTSLCRGYKRLYIFAKNSNYLLYDRSCQRELKSLFTISDNICFTMLPQMASTCFMTEVAINGNLKWQFLLTSKLLTICFIIKVANFYWPQSCQNDNYLFYDRNCHKWFHVIAKNGNKRNDLQLYRELKSLFAISDNILHFHQ